MKERTLIALGTLLAVVLSSQVRSHAAAEQTSKESPAQRFYVGLVSFERNTNCVVRHVLAKLTGQPAPALHARPERLQKSDAATAERY